MAEAELIMIGWREWLAVPDWGIGALKAKVDTGARTSALHAERVERDTVDGDPWVSFVTRPWQGHDGDPVEVRAPMVGEGEVRSSNGEVELRPVVSLRLAPAVGEPGPAFDDPIEVTLTDRSEMGFRMLLGRTALAGHFAVDAGSSYLLGRPARAIRNRNRRMTADEPKSTSNR